jgi:hypothetical protein
MAIRSQLMGDAGGQQAYEQSDVHQTADTSGPPNVFFVGEYTTYRGGAWRPQG